MSDIAIKSSHPLNPSMVSRSISMHHVPSNLFAFYSQIRDGSSPWADARQVAMSTVMQFFDLGWQGGSS